MFDRLTLWMARKFAWMAADERGRGYRYVKAADAPWCLYAHETAGEDKALACGCIVAEVLTRAGLPLADLHAFEGTPADELPEVWFANDVVIDWLGALQRRQDEGTSWGESINEADARVATLYGPAILMANGY